MKYCPRCGHMCRDEDALCSRCGYILGTQPARPPFSPPYGPPARRSGTASASLALGVLSILGMFGMVGFLMAPAAVILGIRALREIRRSGGALRGTGLAVAGIVTGGIVCVIAAVLAAAVLMNGSFVIRHGSLGGGPGALPLPGGQSGIPT